MRTLGFRDRRQRVKRMIILLAATVVCILIVAAAGIISYGYLNREKPLHAEDYLKTYFDLLDAKRFEDMYAMLTPGAQANITKDDFVERYTNIMDGIEANNIKVSIPENEDKKYPDTVTISYEATMDTLAGSVSYKNTAILMRNEDKVYQLNWDSQDIYPNLKAGDKIKVSSEKATRGAIYDRNGNILAGPGTAYSVGVVPGKVTEPKADSYAQLANLLGITVEKIEKSMSASWVKDDSFVPLRTISKNEQDLKTQLLQIKGVMISDVELRTYPLGQAAAHITGYVQSITAEELKELEGKGYNSNSVLGKAGLEKVYEDRLHGTDGASIDIYDEEGNPKENVITSQPKNGEDIFVTIDSNLQSKMYQEIQADSGCSVALNPKTGEVLAAVSTPAYDPNDFVMGYTSAEWDALNQDPAQPFYNRITGTTVPGSSFKPIVAAIGLMEGTLDPNADVANSGLQWQKDTSWGSYYVTTLEDYGPKNLMNALIYSDNIYFAKTALGIGKEAFQKDLTAFGFGESIPFALSTKASSYGTDGAIADEIELADSGYGQGKILVNPLHLASLYATFINGGNMPTPTLEKTDASVTYWKQNIFSSDIANMVLQDMIQIVADPNGTGHQAFAADRVIAGKTGTAEIKASKNDTAGTEIGWFIGMTPQDQQNPVVMLMMVENVKDRGGSHYVVPKVKNCLDAYYASANQ